MKTFILFIPVFWTWKSDGGYICAIQNIALNKMASQSSVAFGGVAERGVDGNMDNRYSKDSCTHTSHANNSWWKVDLGFIANIASINITNRLDPYTYHRLREFKVCLSNSSTVQFNSSECETQHSPIGNGETRSYSFGSSAQVVFIKKHQGYILPLTLCEVQVFAEVCTMITTMESTESTQRTPNTSPTCVCNCRANVSIPQTIEELEAQIAKLKRELTVNKKETSSHIRKLISAPDDRTSSKCVGGVGIILLCVPVIVVVAMDMSRFVSYLRSNRVSSDDQI